MKLITLVLCSALLAGALSLPLPAGATLGEKADSVARDRHALSAVRKATTSYSNYTVQEVASDATTVREYLNLEGVVFAVAWQGRLHPDLTTLLGSYASEFQNAMQKQARRHGQRGLSVSSDKVVVETWGHMGSLQGRAYLPALLPEGVSADEIN